MRNITLPDYDAQEIAVDLGTVYKYAVVTPAYIQGPPNGPPTLHRDLHDACRRANRLSTWGTNDIVIVARDGLTYADWWYGSVHSESWLGDSVKLPICEG